MKIIADTGPLIGLAKIGHLALLAHFAEDVLIPPAVRRELLAKPGAEAAEIDRALGGLLRVVKPEPVDPSCRDAVVQLGEGEWQALERATRYGDEVLLLLDDRAGRRVAQQLEIPTGGPPAAPEGKRRSGGPHASAWSAAKKKATGSLMIS